MSASPGSPRNFGGWRQPGGAGCERPVHPRRLPRPVRPSGLELTRQRGWKCRFLVQSLSSCPTPSPEMLEALELHLVPKSAEHRTGDGIPWPQIYGHYLDQCRSIHDTIKAMPHLRPDLVVAHGGRGAPSLFLREVLDCPIIIYCEYYFANSHRDISYRIDLPPAEPAPFFPRCINAPTLATPGRLRRRLFGHPMAEAIVPVAVPVQDRGALRRDRHGALPPWPGPSADRRAVRYLPARAWSHSHRAGSSRSADSTSS